MTERIAVLIAAYNPDPEKLLASIESIRSQSVKSDIYIVDDGSDVKINDTVSNMNDVTCITLEQNMGVTCATIVGMSTICDAGYEYVARMDVGDISYPDRLKIQSEFLDSNPDVYLVGSRARVIAPNGDYVSDFGLSGDNNKILSYLWLNSAFRHSTFFFRVDGIRELGNYDGGQKLALDYEMLFRYALQGRVFGLSDILIEDIENPNGLTIKRRNKQIRMRLRAQWKHRVFLQPMWYVGVIRAILTMVLPYSFIRYLMKVKHSINLNKAT